MSGNGVWGCQWLDPETLSPSKQGTPWGPPKTCAYTLLKPSADPVPAADDKSWDPPGWSEMSAVPTEDFQTLFQWKRLDKHLRFSINPQDMLLAYNSILTWNFTTSQPVSAFHEKFSFQGAGWTQAVATVWPGDEKYGDQSGFVFSLSSWSGTTFWNCDPHPSSVSYLTASSLITAEDLHFH